MLKILRGKYDETCVTEKHGYSPELSEIIGAHSNDIHARLHFCLPFCLL